MCLDQGCISLQPFCVIMDTTQLPWRMLQQMHKKGIVV